MKGHTRYTSHKDSEDGGTGKYYSYTINRTNDRGSGRSHLNSSKANAQLTGTDAWETERAHPAPQAERARGEQEAAP